MAPASGPWTRAVAVFLTPLILFAGVAIAANLVIESSPSPGYYETVAYLPPVNLSACGQNQHMVGPPFSETFQGVVFHLQLVDLCGPAGTYLNTTVVEPNGTTFHFSVPAWTNETWFSPDKSCGVRVLNIPNQDAVMLLVRS